MKPSKNQIAAASIFGAVSGALALYLAKRPDLRKKLTKSDTPADAIKAFGDHVQQDSSQLVKSLREFADKHMPAVRSAKRAVKKETKKMKKEVATAVKKGTAAVAEVMAKE